MASRLTKVKVYDFQKGLCCYCDVAMVLNPDGSSRKLTKHPRFATWDHLKRKAEGGSNRLENLALACQECNSMRGATNWVEYKSRKGRFFLPLNL